MLQAEFSLTQVLDRPVSGRVFFEQVIRDNLDAGPPGPGVAGLRPPDLPRSQTIHSGPFRTRVITEGSPPACTSTTRNTTIKQYHKQGQGPAHRDHHQRHPRLRDRETAD